MTTSITGLLQTLRILPSAVQQQKPLPPTQLYSAAHVLAKKQLIAPQTCALPIIALETVSHHDDYEDCWIVIYDRVYNVTGFLREHPGGGDIIMDHAGRDATLAFHGTGHSSDAIAQMRDYLIGELPTSERIFRTTNSQVLSSGIPE